MHCRHCSSVSRSVVCDGLISHEDAFIYAELTLGSVVFYPPLLYSWYDYRRSVAQERSERSSSQDEGGERTPLLGGGNGSQA
jgi:hypothetical protein